MKDRDPYVPQALNWVGVPKLAHETLHVSPPLTVVKIGPWDRGGVIIHLAPIRQSTWERMVLDRLDTGDWRLRLMAADGRQPPLKGARK